MGDFQQLHRLTVPRPTLRRAGMVLVASVLVASVAAWGSSAPAVTPQAGSAPTKPNIVFLLTDDLSSNLVTKDLMPTLWSLRSHAAVFANYFVTDSLCCPSRASILTGNFPHDTQIFSNDRGYRKFTKRGEAESTFATDLQSAGYATAFMGKYLNGYRSTDPIPRGWSRWVGVENGYAEYNYSVRDQNTVRKYGGRKGPVDNYLTDVLAQDATGFIDSTKRSTPLFLDLSTFAPHVPFVPAVKYAKLYPHIKYPADPSFNQPNSNAPAWLAAHTALSPKQLDLQLRDYRLRARQMKSVDDAIERIVASLEETHRWDNTFFVFSSDNGLHLGEHQLSQGKQTAFETDIHVPLIVTGPGVVASEPAHFSQNIDLRSTFDSIAGVAPPTPVDGHSLLPVLLAGSTGVPDGLALIEHKGPVTTPGDPDLPSPTSGNPPSYEALRGAGYVYVEYVTGEREYYDLVADPYERANVYSTLTPARVAALHAQLVHLQTCHSNTQC